MRFFLEYRSGKESISTLHCKEEDDEEKEEEEEERREQREESQKRERRTHIHTHITHISLSQKLRISPHSSFSLSLFTFLSYLSLATCFVSKRLRRAAARECIATLWTASISRNAARCCPFP
jgi:hypothetical protein